MTIEFHCPQCHKLLKTADDKAGVEAKCPGCGDVLVVPELSEGIDRHDAAEGPVIAETELFGERVLPSTMGPESIRPCPVCGEPISCASDRCPSCGEPLALEGNDAPPQMPHFVTSDILGRTWAIFQQKIGVLLGVSFLLWVIQVLFIVVAYGLFFGIVFFVERAELDSPTGILVGSAVLIPGLILWSIVTCLLQGGYRRLLVDVAQGKPANFSQLFSGGRFFWRLLGANLLFGALVTAGSLLLVAPGVYAAVALWPYSYVLVDQDCGVVDAFERSWKLTIGNRLAGFVLMLALVGIHFAGSFIPCLSFFAAILTEPFALLSLAVAYVEMNGRLTAERNPPG